MGIIIVIFANYFGMMGTGENLLFKISSPEDIKKLDPIDLVKVSKELRQYILEALSHNPGHLGASLGVVEPIALHYVLIFLMIK